MRERAVSDPRAAEILLRWLQRPRTEERVGGVDLDSMSERELERLYAGLLKLAALPDEELQRWLEPARRQRDCVSDWLVRSYRSKADPGGSWGYPRELAVPPRRITGEQRFP